MNISQKYQKLLAKRRETEASIFQLQQECTHPEATFVHSSDTGNWCKGDDMYWKDWKCQDCGKYWREYQ